MRLIIVGTLNGQIGAASKIAMDRGAKVTQVDTIDGAMEQLRRGQGADLALVDVHEDIRRLVQQLALERFSLPVVACGIGNDSRAAVEAIRAGAKEYLPLPPDPELIAAVLEAVADESHQLIHRDPAIRKVLELADQVAKSTRVDPDHRRERHRQGSAGALYPRQERPLRRRLHLGQLRGDPGQPAGIGAVRSREGRLHRRRGAPGRQVRGEPMAAPSCWTR